ncbi:methylated-DNA--[protein]-cysteine S-methyltransferase [Thauera sinica]|uniref:Methylated-DNA--[protein]-cysteine S-methyltransferase n=1 Tax=Thauera sinica TaxID=2665146 RepID=A0ABW1AY55_9RHOO|nr:methylated-DNA--[protein]-cysteine S-methyltransferase [Thauera sp. K11]ATE59065.1 cysteine methyltransferase [Thauera sp. K11]
MDRLRQWRGAQIDKDSLNASCGTVLALPFGPFGIRIADGLVEELCFLPPGTPLRAPGDELAERAAAAILAWLDDPRGMPDLPFARRGTPFRQRVWHAISGIPPGETRSYGALAQAVGSVPRAVGQACGANPFPLFVPCHRVTAAADIGGFANARGGWLIDAKRWLLAHEAGR